MNLKKNTKQLDALNPLERKKISLMFIFYRIIVQISIKNIKQDLTPK